MKYGAYLIAAAVAGALSSVAACGSSDSTTGAGGSPATNSSSASATSSESASASATSSASATASASSGAGGSGGTGAGGNGGNGGAGGQSNLVNGCDPATAQDHLNDANVEIKFGGDLGESYSPKCIKVKAGASVTFTADTFMATMMQDSFGSHPLQGGKVVGGVEMPDPNSPIKATGAGTSAMFPLPNAGDYGFYCMFHGGFGMSGAVFVQ